jgi:guanylate kinase
MLVLSSSSGAGKTTLTRTLLQRDSGLTLSISVTTRPQRTGEQPGVHYHFVTRQEFLALREEGALLEWAEVFGNHYGTPRAPVEEALQSGRDVLFDIDWQGARQLAQIAHDDLASVFILPPSRTALEQRLRQRGSDAEEVIARRLAEASREMEHWREYDYVLINDDLETCLGQLTVILHAERLRRPRGLHLEDFVGRLIGES